MSYSQYSRTQWSDSRSSAREPAGYSSGGYLTVYGILILCGAYYTLQRVDIFPLLPIQEAVWNALVGITPRSFLVALDRHLNPKLYESDGVDETSSGLSGKPQAFAAKSEIMRRLLGLDGGGVLAKLQRTRTFSGVGSLLLKGPPLAAPPGLGNWDNSCYQNSVIQGLAALPSVPSFLDCNGSDGGVVAAESTVSTRGALAHVIAQLNDPANAGTRLWTPAALKSMSSWQQQDAQEYFSRVIDDVEKEIMRDLKAARKHEGLRMIKNMVGKEQENGETPEAGAKRSQMSLQEDVDGSKADASLRNPLEGMLAQRVGCLRCGYVEGLALTPFNCVTLPLGRQWSQSVTECLDEYTQLENIEGVECGRCTLLQKREQLQHLLQTSRKPGMESILQSAKDRLSNVVQALEDGDFSDAVLKRCQVPAKGRVSSTKTRQAVVARPPESLVLHVNRSIFDEMTGMLSKNHASVSFPEKLDLSPWCLGTARDGTDGDIENWITDPNTSLLAGEQYWDDSAAQTPTQTECPYVLRAVITHYGRHENGHYICYRRDPDDEEKWWRLSDDDVSSSSRDNVLGQSGVFMLFYTRLHSNPTSKQGTEMQAQAAQSSSAEAEGISSSSLENEGPAKDLGHDLTPKSQDSDWAKIDVRTETTSVQDVDPDGGEPQGHADAALLPTQTVPEPTDEGPLLPSDLPVMDERQADARPVAPPMRTANAPSKRRKKDKRRGLSSMSSMVAAN